MNAPIDRDDLTVKPEGISMSSQIAALKGKLLKNIRRSVYVYRVDCGGCNGCEIEIFAAITPIFDAERFGIKVVPSPRHADILLYTGSVTRAMRMPGIRAYEAAPEPKIVVSYGACGCSGGIFHDLYCVWGGADKIVPVDVYIPGCPPSPQATIYGFAMALGLLDQKLHETTHIEGEHETVPLTHPEVPYGLRVALERRARQLAGYRQGRLLTEDFLAAVLTQDLAHPEDLAPPDLRIAKLIAEQQDLRKAEIFGQLRSVFNGMIAQEPS